MQPKVLFIYMICFIFCGCADRKSKLQLLDYVNPFIGTGGHGHTFMGVSVPFGAVQVGPNNYYKGWDWCSGFHISDSILIGFSHLHLSGTGCAELGDVLVMPISGKNRFSHSRVLNASEGGYVSKYKVESIVANPAYFRILLDRYDIQAELTATERVGFHRYTYTNKNDLAHLLINLENGNIKKEKVETYLKKLNDSTIVGYRKSSSWWVKDQRVYFALKTNIPIHTIHWFEGNKEVICLDNCGGIASKAMLSFAPDTEELLVKISISPVSIDGALSNMSTEISHWDFNKIVSETSQKWNTELRKTCVETKDENEKIKFYTARYHTMIAPALFNDIDGSYRGANAENHPNPGFDIYTTFSLWDTYRAAHPLMTLLNPERVPDIVKTMLKIYDEQGKLPVWHLAGCETDIMVGYHAAPIILDAYLKGVRDFDTQKALEAMIVSSNREDNASNLVEQYGYVPSDKTKASVAKTLEYAIDDWCIAYYAKQLGKKKIADRYFKRAQSYRNIFDIRTGFFRGKTTKGKWVEDFDPCRSKHRNDVYCEGNAWQYTWLVPHDVDGLVELYGSERAFINKLDSLFLINEDMGKEASLDISGLIGMYAHGNEPGHHTIYLYSYVGEQWKSAEKARQVMNEMYTSASDGIVGNEDCGQMSAWYIFSSMGFYPVNPSIGMYVFGSPVFDKVIITLPENHQFIIETVNNGKENIYIEKVELNGKPYEKSYIMHSDIVKGGYLKIYMSRIPNKEFGRQKYNRPYSLK